jgi:hypothetical protein
LVVVVRVDLVLRLRVHTFIVHPGVATDSRSSGAAHA